MSYPIHRDERGFFQELLKSKLGLAEIRQISIVCVNPGFVRGGHFHKRMVESFVVIDGSMELTLESKSGEKKVVVMTQEENQVVDIVPMVKHTVFSKDGCKFLTVQNALHNPDSPDCFRDFK